MLKPLVVGFLGGVSCLLCASLSQAQCTKDTDCKGARVCEAGACVEQSPALGAAGATAPTPAPAAPPPPIAAPAPVAPLPQPAAPAMQRHSTGMMAGGIVMLSFVPIALLASLVADSDQKACEGGDVFSGEVARGTNCGAYDKTIYGGLVVALGLTGGGIPLIIIGGKKEPVGTMQVTPWATRNAGGLALHVDL